MKHVNCMTHNLAGHLDQFKRRDAADAALVKCLGGIGVLNEINPKDVKFLRGQLKELKLKWYRRGQNAIVWDPSVLEMHACGFRVIMRGGRVGADGVAGVGDDRRVGPNRIAIKWKGEIIDEDRLGVPLMVIGIHKMAKAFTAHRWRAPLWWRSTRAVSRYVNRSIKNYPRGFIAGDENAPFLVDYPNLDDRAIPTPPTLGRQRYDQVHVFGDLGYDNMEEFATPSDHDGLRWRIFRKGAFRPN
jgi:hypothetical protein